MKVLDSSSSSKKLLTTRELFDFLFEGEKESESSSWSSWFKKVRWCQVYLRFFLQEKGCEEAIIILESSKEWPPILWSVLSKDVLCSSSHRGQIQWQMASSLIWRPAKMRIAVAAPCLSKTETPLSSAASRQTRPYSKKKTCQLWVRLGKLRWFRASFYSCWKASLLKIFLLQTR